MDNISRLYRLLWDISTTGQRLNFLFILLCILVLAVGEYFLMFFAYDFVLGLSTLSATQPDYDAVFKLIYVALCLFIVDILRVYIVVANARHSYALGAKLTSSYFANFIRFNVENVELNSAEAVSSLTTKGYSTVNNAIVPVITIINALATTIMVFVAIWLINPKAALLTSTVIFLIYGLVYVGSKSFSAEAVEL